MQIQKKVWIWLCAAVICMGLLTACGVAHTPPAESDEIPRTYEIQVQIPENLPRIDVRTIDGTNRFATVPTRYIQWSVDCEISVSNCEETYILDKVDASIKARGNNTVEHPKKPFRITFNKKQNMLGLNDGAKCKKWVLLAEWNDSSMLRNATALYLARNLLGADGYYVSDFCMVELYINKQYWGVYLLVEQQQVNPNRVNVYEPPKDYEGIDIGYLVEWDGWYDDDGKYVDDEPLQVFVTGENPVMTTLDGNTVQTQECGYTIKSDIHSQAQHDFIAAYMENVLKICYEAAYHGKYYAFNDTYTALTESPAASVEETVSAVLDVDSLVDMYILYEIVCDSDMAGASFFMRVDMSENGSKKLVFEAPWDFDYTCGIQEKSRNPAVYYAANSDNHWFTLFIREDWFMDKVKARWQDAAAAGVFTGVLEMIGDYRNIYAEEFAENYTRWDNMGMDVGWVLVPEVKSFRTQSDAAQYLYTWLEARIQFLEGEWGADA